MHAKAGFHGKVPDIKQTLLFHYIFFVMRLSAPSNRPLILLELIFFICKMGIMILSFPPGNFKAQALFD